jgi:hypothetical protein
MRFMVIVKATKDSEAGVPPPMERMAAMAKLAEAATRNGTLVSTVGSCRARRAPAWPSLAASSR